MLAQQVSLLKVLVSEAAIVRRRTERPVAIGEKQLRNVCDKSKHGGNPGRMRLLES